MKVFPLNMLLLTCVFMLLSASLNAETICTAQVKVTELYPREGGWTHVRLEGIADADLSNCGNHGSLALLLNYNDTVGTLDGKKILLATLMAAKMTGEPIRLCSTGCDTQHPSYSRLSHIDRF